MRVFITMLGLLLGCSLISYSAQAAPPDRPRAEQPAMTPAQAAAKAQRQHGGRVLAVKPEGSGYRVKLLQPSGRVIQVFIGNGNNRR